MESQAAEREFGQRKAEQALGKTPRPHSTFGCHVKSMAQCGRAIAVLSRASAGRQSAALFRPTTVASLVHCGCGIYAAPSFSITVPWFSSVHQDLPCQAVGDQWSEPATTGPRRAHFLCAQSPLLGSETRRWPMKYGGKSAEGTSVKNFVF